MATGCSTTRIRGGRPALEQLGIGRGTVVVAIFLVIFGSAGLAAQAAPANRDSLNAYRRMSAREYASRVLGPRALLGDIAIAGVQQGLGQPRQWPKTWRGYGDRASSRLGTAAIAQAVVFGVSNVLDERPARFTLCGCTDAESRIRHALATPLRMDTPRGPRLSALAPLSEIGSAILVTGLHPGGFSARDGLIGGAIGVVGASAGAVAREFWPWHRRPFGI
jgi:hypothetical protein